MVLDMVVDTGRSYLESIQSPGRATMAIGRKSDEHICTDAVAIDNHLQPAETRYVAHVGVFAIVLFLLILQATVLA